MNYDYTQAKKMMRKIPNLNTTYKKLIPISSTSRYLGNHFGFLYFLAIGTVGFATFMNMNILGSSQDFVHDFRIKPDFLTNKRFISYRKQEKQFNIY